jgi:hypothetical protein
LDGVIDRGFAGISSAAPGEVCLPLIAELAGYLAAFAFAHNKNFIMTQGVCIYKTINQGSRGQSLPEIL